MNRDEAIAVIECATDKRVADGPGALADAWHISWVLADACVTLDPKLERPSNPMVCGTDG